MDLDMIYFVTEETQFCVNGGLHTDLNQCNRGIYANVLCFQGAFFRKFGPYVLACSFIRGCLCIRQVRVCKGVGVILFYVHTDKG